MNLMILVITLSWVSGLAPTVMTQGQPNAIIRGRVYDNRFGLPVSGAKATVLSHGRVQQDTTSDQGGGYEFKNLAEGQYTILVESLGFARTERNAQVRRGEQILLDIPLRIGHLHDPSPIEINGTVTLADNTPPSDVTILVISPFDQEIVAKAKTNHTGHYAAKVDDPGQYVLYAFKPGFQVSALPIILSPTLPRKPYSRDIVLSPFNL